MPAKSTLQDSPIIGTIEERAPLLQFAHAIGRLLRVKLCHTPIIEKLPAAHGVTEVGAPVVSRVHITHGRSNPALGHDGMRLAEKRFAYNANACALGQCFDCGTKPSSAGPDDQHIMFVSFVFVVHG